ncbi:hypothetical protein RvY_06989 [Ramazzottius varieornatus]|uniref:Uncharacterized protein n=1 Tax=Ramazzottius varieornatus TaxID=947166 RepID=A0A1D1V0H8_RAMVA|nr:hypothetical protein RvY_06989 [Ramazzottius varieornatus]
MASLWVASAGVTWLAGSGRLAGLAFTCCVGLGATVAAMVDAATIGFWLVAAILIPTAAGILVGEAGSWIGCIRSLAKNTIALVIVATIIRSKMKIGSRATTRLTCQRQTFRTDGSTEIVVEHKDRFIGVADTRHCDVLEIF